MPAPGGGNLKPSKVDGYFKKWINDYKSGKDKKGHIVLEHELNSATVNMSMFWMPKLQETFNVIPALACNGIQNPYWEEGWVRIIKVSIIIAINIQCRSQVYPTANVAQPSNTATATGTKTTTATASPTPGSCTPGSYGLGNGDGYNGACCKDQSDCLDDCLSGKCNGPVNTKTATVTSTKTSTKSTSTASPTSTTCTSGSYGLGKGDGYNGACCKDQSDCWDDCLGGKCNGPVNTATTKASTKTSTKTPTASASCTPGSRGKKRGDGKNGYCCSSSDDCLETCRSGTCGL